MAELVPQQGLPLLGEKVQPVRGEGDAAALGHGLGPAVGHGLAAVEPDAGEIHAKGALHLGLDLAGEIDPLPRLFGGRQGHSCAQGVHGGGGHPRRGWAAVGRGVVLFQICLHITPAFLVCCLTDQMLFLDLKKYTGPAGKNQGSLPETLWDVTKCIHMHPPAAQRRSGAAAAPDLLCMRYVERAFIPQSSGYR